MAHRCTGESFTLNIHKSKIKSPKYLKFFWEYINILIAKNFIYFLIIDNLLDLSMLSIKIIKVSIFPGN